MPRTWYDYCCMIVVIIAGGSGSRLWPLSTPDFPKQLLSLTNEKSMVQNTYERAKRLGSEIYVVPVKDIIPQIKAQLSELDDEHIINEPARRGTANCIVAALAHIAGPSRSSALNRHSRPPALATSSATGSSKKAFTPTKSNRSKKNRISTPPSAT